MYGNPDQFYSLSNRTKACKNKPYNLHEAELRICSYGKGMGQEGKDDRETGKERREERKVGIEEGKGDIYICRL